MKPGITEFLEQKRIAVVGVSRTRGFGNNIAQHLTECGYDVYPVNANADAINGRPCYRSLGNLPEPADAVVTVVPPQQTLQIIDDCARLGIKHVWMQQGSESTTAISKAEAGGLSVIHHSCVLMYARPTGIHRFHRKIMDFFGRS